MRKTGGQDEGCVRDEAGHYVRKGEGEREGLWATHGDRRHPRRWDVRQLRYHAPTLHSLILLRLSRLDISIEEYRYQPWP